MHEDRSVEIAERKWQISKDSEEFEETEEEAQEHESEEKERERERGRSGGLIAVLLRRKEGG